MNFFKPTFVKNLFILKRRFLTSGEKALALEVFGASLVVDNIEIKAHRLVLKDYAVSPNGHIYFHLQDWREDFSLESVSIQSWLIHELTHVWQIQQGIAVVQKALLDRRYHYVLQMGKAFSQYGVEQQAQMVQDYFIKSRQGKNCEAYQQCIPFLAKACVSQNKIE